MKNSIYKITASILVAINITGCSLLPYEETFICNKGLNSGSCQSVSENYRDTFVDKNSIPLTLKQKEVLIEQVEDQGIIDNTWFGNDEVLDWQQMTEFNKPRLQHILDTYDFDDATVERIQKLINNTESADINYRKMQQNKALENEELFKYLRLRNEYLNEENIKLKNSK